LGKTREKLEMMERRKTEGEKNNENDQEGKRN